MGNICSLMPCQGWWDDSWTKAEGWGQWEAHPSQSEVSPVTLDASQHYSPSSKWCIFVKGWSAVPASHYYHVNFKKWRNSLLFPINSETTMMMWRQKVRDIHLAFSSSDRILGSGAVHWARVWSFQWKASVETWVRLRNLMLLPDKWPA